LPFLDLHLPVYNHVFDTFWVNVRVLDGRFVIIVFRIENDDVGSCSGPKHAPIRNAYLSCRQAGTTADTFFQRELFFVFYVGFKEMREVVVGKWGEIAVCVNSVLCQTGCIRGYRAIGII